MVDHCQNHLQIGRFLLIWGADCLSVLEFVMTMRMGGRAILRLEVELSERDQAVMTSVAEHHFLSTRQIEAFHFADHATALSGARVCRRVLERLTAHRLLVRLERRIGGVRAGSASFIYAVGPVGDRLIRPDSPRRRFREPSTAFLDHTLAIADAHLVLVDADRSGAFELVAIETEPGCWRRYVGVGGSAEVLRPDLFVVTASGEVENCWFLEIDRATESSTAVVRKCRQYASYFHSGIEQERLGTFPRVVWVVPGERRRTLLERAITGAKGLPEGLFRVVAADELSQLVAGGTL